MKSITHNAMCRAGSLALAAGIILAGRWVSSTSAAVYDLQNGVMENAGGYSVAPGWTSYRDGLANAATWAKDTVLFHGGAASQKITYTNGVNGSFAGVRQTIDALVGDAITLSAYIYPNSPATAQRASLGVQLDGTTNRPATWLQSATTRTAWNALQGAVNATNTTVTVFLDTARITNSAIHVNIDDVVDYHAFVPPAPSLGSATANSLDVDVDPGNNSSNALAEYAVTIGGGAYTLGSNWLQSDGSVGASSQWLTDASWGTKTVTGLDPSTTYTLEAVARYSSAITLSTTLAAATGNSLTTIPEPAMLVLLALGGLAIGRRR